MSFDPHLSTRATIAEYFAARAERFPNLLTRVEEFFAKPSLETGKQLLRAYFRNHTVGDIASLRMATASFADKRLVRAVVESILNDDAAFAGIAARSYPHPIGFDKLVLDDDRDTGFKFRLHVYWRGANFASLERLHLHRFEMASAIVTGELTNHIWRVVDFKPANGLLTGMTLAKPVAATGDVRMMAPAYAYAGYRRDEKGNLRKTYLGEAVLEPGPSDTFTSGDAYAQILEDAHFVETNAETGFANGDFCSTIYIHGPSLTDRSGRAMPILFEEQRLADDNALISTIPAIPVEALRVCLIRYRDTLDEILKYYDWLYHPKHGRNLSVGMVAGYLLCESFKTPHAIDVFERRYDECKEVLNYYENGLRKLMEGGTAPKDFDDANDRKWRYVRLLLAKANEHPGGPRQWLEDYGSLTKEMWRYFGAIRGEVNPRITVLKPIWEHAVQRKLPGGMHYGHIGAMIEAAFDANAIGAKHFDDHLQAIHKDEHNITSIVDDEIECRIREVLKGHFSTYRFCGEEGGDADHSAPVVGARRFLVDPLDGTRNFLGRRQEFCTAIACQEWTGEKWLTTDGVVAHPASGRIFWAERGQGAFVIERNDHEHRAMVRPLAVDSKNPLRHQLIDYSARGLDIECQVEVFRELVARNAAIRNSGSVALILVCMAGSGGSGTILTAKDHDVEAGLLIAREAGARITQIEFQTDEEPRTATIVGADPRVHDALVVMLKEKLAKRGQRVLCEMPNAPPMPLQ
jgi:fructose-1,6-bisphosphatase/inositol monophosphatase family enzyme